MYLNVGGHRAYAYTAGRSIDGNKPTAVFVHGAANDHSVWALQSRYFAYHGWNVLAVDLPGHGKSQGNARESIEALAHWVMELLDAAGVARAALIGHSMGSLVSLHAAASEPARVARLALVGTAIPMAVSEALLASSKANDHVAFEMINAYSHSPAAQIGGNRVPGLWMLGNNLRLMERSAPGVLHADFVACNSYTAGLEAAGKIACPVLLILGKRDLMTPMKSARELAARLKDAKVVALDGAGHALMAEKPDEVLDALIGFLTGRDP
ncbi:MAG TPA: alpha/beta hydrolase [Burkholderiales bacterium]|nr:alpha/beta hydrolase [Burkholderiales bacterium]